VLSSALADATLLTVELAAPLVVTPVLIVTVWLPLVEPLLED